MAKGSIAKINVAAKIAEVFGEDFIGEHDKKYYVWAEENGERLQIAISMTCPKVAIEGGNSVAPATDNNGDWNFEDTPAPAVFGGVSVASKPAEITQEEQDRALELMRRLNL